MDQMTQENYEKIKAKLDELKKKRPVISKTIGEAREHGDLKENSAYHTAKDERDRDGTSVHHKYVLEPEEKKFPSW